MTDTRTDDNQFASLEALTQSNDFEAVHAGLTEALRLLESPGIGLNASIRAYEVGRKLSDRCQALLDAAELRITQLDGDKPVVE